jgi:hypothetical protein
MLISLGGLLGPELERATQASLDLAAGLGIDLASATDKVARAALGSVREFTRLGVTFRDGASVTEKFESVLGFIEARFTGMAQAEIDTTAGKVHELAESWSEFKEAVGGFAVSGAGVPSVLDAMTRSLRDLATVTEKGTWVEKLAVIAAALNPLSMGIGAGVAAGIEARGKAVEKSLVDIIQEEDDAWRLRQQKINDHNAKELATAREHAQKLVEAFLKKAKVETAPSTINEWGVEVPITLVWPENLPDVPPINMDPAYSAQIREQIEFEERWKEVASDRAEVVNQAWRDLKEPMTSVAQAQAVVVETTRALAEVSLTADESLRLQAEAAIEAGKAYEELAAKQQFVQEAIQGVAVAFGESIVMMATDALTFKEVIRSMLKALLLALAQYATTQGGIMLAAAAAYAIAQQYGKAARAIASAAMWFVLAGATGATAAAMAKGGIVAGVGDRDTVPALLTPGEGVLTRAETALVTSGRAAVVSARSAAPSAGTMRAALGGHARLMPMGGMAAFAHGGVVSGYSVMPGPTLSSARGVGSVSVSMPVAIYALDRIDTPQVERFMERHHRAVASAVRRAAERGAL